MNKFSIKININNESENKYQKILKIKKILKKCLINIYVKYFF